MNLRTQKIYASLAQRNLDGLIVSSPANISYLTDYTSRDSYLIISKKGNIYITDSRYSEEAKKYIKRLATIVKIDTSLFKVIADACNTLKFKRIGFEERHLVFKGYKNINKGLNKNCVLIPTDGLIEELRQIKNAEELGKIKKAVQVTIKAFKFIKNLLVPGMTELEAAAELECFIRYNGATNSAFDIIVASGPNSSYPHHLTSRRKIENNEPVLIDLGVEYMGYKSDLTRVFFLGKINSAYRKIYSIVCKAQDKAIKEIKATVPINKIDTAARQYITREGYGGFFGHNSGHGIGLETHEQPYICAKENNKLKPGMVFTIEPGIYLPNKFGIRLEDIVSITGKGIEVISGALDK